MKPFQNYRPLKPNSSPQELTIIGDMLKEEDLLQINERNI